MKQVRWLSPGVRSLVLLFVFVSGLNAGLGQEVKKGKRARVSATQLLSKNPNAFYHQKMSIKGDLVIDTDIFPQYQTLSATLNASRNAALDIVYVNNAGILSDSVYTLNQKIVNDIYLSTVARGQFAFNPLQIQQLENLIYQCPLAGGPNRREIHYAISRRRKQHSYKTKV